jgi:hypothetical protein
VRFSVSGANGKLYVSFGVFWTMFEILFMFAPVFYLIHMVVVRSNSLNSEADEKGSKWLRLRRLLHHDVKFTFCSFALAISIAIYFLLQLLLISFYPLLGRSRTKNAFTFVKLFFQILPNVLNCILLDHIPVVVANRYKYQQPLPKSGTKLMLLKFAPTSSHERRRRSANYSSEA